MAKLKFLAHLPVDHLAYPVVARLILLLSKFATFAYNVIDTFVSITTLYYIVVVAVVVVDVVVVATIISFRVFHISFS